MFLLQQAGQWRERKHHYAQVIKAAAANGQIGPGPPFGTAQDRACCTRAPGVLIHSASTYAVPRGCAPSAAKGLGSMVEFAISLPVISLNVGSLIRSSPDAYSTSHRLACASGPHTCRRGLRNKAEPWSRCELDQPADQVRISRSTANIAGTGSPISRARSRDNPLRFCRGYRRPDHQGRQ